MNRKALALVLIASIILSIAAWFAQSQISELQSQNSDLEHQINELQDQNRDLQDENDELQEQLDLLQKRVDFSPYVQITQFSSKEGWWNPVGVTVALDFNVTIVNTGMSDIEGLTLEIRRLNVDEDPYNITRRLDILPAREKTEIYDHMFLGMTFYFDEFINRSLVATLRLGDVVLDVRHFLPGQYP